MLVGEEMSSGANVIIILVVQGLIDGPASHVEAAKNVASQNPREPCKLSRKGFISIVIGCEREKNLHRGLIPPGGVLNETIFKLSSKFEY